MFGGSSWKKGILHRKIIPKMQMYTSLNKLKGIEPIIDILLLGCCISFSCTLIRYSWLNSKTPLLILFTLSSILKMNELTKNWDPYYRLRLTTNLPLSIYPHILYPLNQYNYHQYWALSIGTFCTVLSEAWLYRINPPPLTYRLPSLVNFWRIFKKNLTDFS